MKNLILFLFPCLIFSQSIKIDTVGISPKVKEVTEKIIMDTQVYESKTDELNKELKKQVELMRELKSKILKLKTANEFSKNKDNIKNSTYIVKKIKTNSDAVKSEEVYIEYNGKRVLWEPKQRTWFGRVFNEEDIIYYPYIIDDNGKQIYIKL